MRRPADGHRVHLRPILALLLLGAVGLSPVEYRGGAEHAHAHAVLQLWDDASDGALDHHELGAAPSASLVSTGVDAPPDTPRLTTLASAKRVSVVLVVVAGPVLAVAASIRVRVVWPTVPLVSALLRAPEPPPPRRVAAFA